MAGTKTILIYAEDIIPGINKMRDKKGPEGRLDLMGQILVTGYGVKVHDNAESPAQQNTAIHPFSRMIRGRANNTELTQTILMNADRLSGKKQVEIANILLDKYENEGITSIETTEVLKVKPLSDLGTPVELVRAFGKKDDFEKALDDLENELYKSA